MKVIERKKLQTIFSKLIIKLKETDLDLIIKIRHAKLQNELIMLFSSFFSLASI